MLRALGLLDMKVANEFQECAVPPLGIFDVIWRERYSNGASCYMLHVCVKSLMTSESTRITHALRTRFGMLLRVLIKLIKLYVTCLCEVTYDF